MNIAPVLYKAPLKSFDEKDSIIFKYFGIPFLAG